MCKEWLNVSELSKILGISRVTAYNKLNKIDKKILHSLQIKSKGIILYNIKIIDILNNIKNIDLEKNYKKDYIEILKQEICYLKAQIKLKDDQILSLNNILNEILKKPKNHEKINFKNISEEKEEKNLDENKHKRKILNAEEVENILKERREGKTIKYLSKKYNSSVGKIHSLIKKLRE